MAPSAIVATVIGLKKQLATAVTANRIEEIKSILRQLKSDVIATEELIRETKIGITVNKLRQNTNSEVADLAKEIVRKWKADVGPAGGRPKKESDKADSPHPSTLPSPSPAPGSPAVNVATKKEIVVIAASTSTTPIASSSRTSPSLPKSKRRESLNGAPRTFKSDELSLKGGDTTYDTLRDKCIELTYDALAGDSDAPEDQILRCAVALEAYVYSENPPPEGTAVYRTKMRSFMLNLKAKNNPSLREDVVSGDISIPRLYTMTPAEMASEEQQAANRKIIENNLFKAQGAAPQQAETDAFKCGRCKQRRTMYYQMQTRSADEPMTTFVTCLSCNLRWKFS